MPIEPDERWWQTDLFSEQPIATSYKKILEQIYRRLCGRRPDVLTPRDLASLLRSRSIARVLEIGAGNGEFLRTMAPVFHDAGVEATAIELNFEPFAEHLLGETGIRTRRSSLASSDFLAEEPPDLVWAVGVFSLGSLFWAGHEVTPNRVCTAADHHHELMRATVGYLSGHPAAAVITSAVSTFLLASRSALAGTCSVLSWELEDRKRAPRWYENTLRRFRAAYSLTDEECAFYEQVWRQSADVAVLAKP
jgi:hypothetical protein